MKLDIIKSHKIASKTKQKIYSWMINPYCANSIFLAPWKHKKIFYRERRKEMLNQDELIFLIFLHITNWSILYSCICYTNMPSVTKVLAYY